MHLSGQPDAADMLQFLSWQLTHAPVQSIYYPTWVLLFRLRAKHEQTDMTDGQFAQIQCDVQWCWWGAHLNPAIVDNIGTSW